MIIHNIDAPLAELIERWQDQPFAWGTADCCQFAIDAQNRLYGLALKFGPYRTERGAARVLARLGGLEQALQSVGLRLLASARLAKRGDVVVWRDEAASKFEGQGLAVCTGRWAQAMGKDGLVPIEQARWHQAWSRNA